MALANLFHFLGLSYLIFKSVGSHHELTLFVYFLFIALHNFNFTFICAIIDYYVSFIRLYAHGGKRLCLYPMLDTVPIDKVHNIC